jgi:hypothetical protein
MSEGIVVVGRRQRSRVEAERLVLEFERSGLSRRAFCAQHGLSVPSLDQYRKRCRAAGTSSKSAHAAAAQAAANRILPMEFVDAGALPVESLRALRVELANGRRIEVAPSDKNHQGYLWQYETPGGSVVFDFRMGREREGPRRQDGPRATSSATQRKSARAADRVACQPPRRTKKRAAKERRLQGRQLPALLMEQAHPLFGIS